jgi:hypothetical protein
VTRRAGGGQAKHVRYLLATLHSGVIDFRAMLANPATFVERELGVDELRVMLQDPIDAVFTARLLVGRREEDDVAIERSAAAHDVLVEQQHRLQVHREHALVVDRSAAIQESLEDFSAEGVGRPALALDTHHIHVREQQHRPRLTRTLQSRHERCARWCRFEEGRLDAGAAKDVVEIPSDAHLSPGRIDGIHPDQRLEMRDAFPERALPVDPFGDVRMSGHWLLARWLDTTHERYAVIRFAAGD